MTITIPILCYDAECILCSRMMQWYFRLEHEPNVVFSPLNSEFSKELGIDNESEDSIIVVDAEGKFQKSEAVFKLVNNLKHPLKVIKIFWVLPRGILDRIYDAIARNRYQWFGRNENGCELGLFDSTRIIHNKNQYLNYNQR